MNLKRIMGASLAKQMRSPDQHSCFGWVAQRIMSMGKGDDSIDAVKALIDSKYKLPQKPVIVELGPGAGYSLREMFDKIQPSKFYAIEISSAFREIIETDKEFSSYIDSGVLSVHGDDAKKLVFIPDNSVDVIFAFNVIYFLDPFEDYLKEMRRILKPGGVLSFGVKDIAKHMENTIYINTDWNVCLDQMKSAGFVDVKQGEIRLEDPLSYIPIYGMKPN
mmetsp:Transcript_12591/g.15492  ORF Transcript_12591/g.15492 Transcript_12591/m.15492 type:complete len:220 (+) Transcript_12591:242-901(+)